jgi:hypothetical protein
MFLANRADKKNCSKNENRTLKCWLLVPESELTRTETSGQTSSLTTARGVAPTCRLLPTELRTKGTSTRTASTSAPKLSIELSHSFLLDNLIVIVWTVLHRAPEQHCVNIQGNIAFVGVQYYSTISRRR